MQHGRPVAGPRRSKGEQRGGTLIFSVVPSAAGGVLKDVLTKQSSLANLEIDLPARPAGAYMARFVEPGEGVRRTLFPKILEVKDVSRIQLWTTSRALFAQLRYARPRMSGMVCRRAQQSGIPPRAVSTNETPRLHRHT